MNNFDELVLMSALIIATGTTACGWVQDLRSRIALLKKQYPEISDNGIQFLAFDTDPSTAYTRSRPWQDYAPNWGPNEHSRLSPPKEEFIKKLYCGQQPGFETLIPQSLRGLGSNAPGAGGTPPNGHFFYLYHRQTIYKKIRNAISFYVKQCENSGRTPTPTLPISLLGTTNGGTASGTLFLLQQIITQVASEMGINIEIVMLVGLPGVMNPSKHQANSQAVSAGWLLEWNARSTGHHFHREKRAGEELLQRVSTPHVHTLFLSDTNNAPANGDLDPHGISRQQQAGMMGELLLNLLIPAFANRRRALALDFQHLAALEPTPITGEPKTVISAGLAEIIFGRDRLQSYVELRLMIAVLNYLLLESSEEESRKQAKTFVRKHSLIEGGGKTDLSDSLGENPTEGGSRLTPALVRTHINQYCSGVGMNLATQAETQAQVAVSQALAPSESLKALFSERKGKKIELIHDDLKTTISEQFLEEGAIASRNFLISTRHLLKHFSQQAAEDNGDFEDAVQNAENGLQSSQNALITYLQALEKKREGILYFLSQSSIEKKIIEKERQAGGSFKNILINHHILQIKTVAHSAAIELLDALIKEVGLSITAMSEVIETLQQLKHELEQGSDGLKALIAHKPTFECPNGIHLHETEEQLENSYPRLLPQGGEREAVRNIVKRLFQDKEFQEVLATPKAFLKELKHEVCQVIEPRIKGLHVIRELRDRYQDEELAHLLKDLDRRAMEMVQFKPSADLEMYVIRLLGIDSAQGGDLPVLLNQYNCDKRRTPYEVCNTSDPDRIVFYQERHLLKTTDLLHWEAFKDSYHEMVKKMDFERFHPIVGDSCLMFPGEQLDEKNAKAIIVRAWVTGHISKKYISNGEEEYYINAGDRPLPVLTAWRTLCKEYLGYGYSVEIISHWNCLFLKKGGHFLKSRLQFLRAVGDGNSAPTEKGEVTIATFLTDPVYKLLLEQIDWWEMNSVEAAMEWYQKR